MRVAAHQPHAFPWLGYLHKVASCDVFVIMDDLQFEAQNFQNRNRIKVNNGPAWLTIPLVRGSQQDRICDKIIAKATNQKDEWQRKTWRTLQTHYGKAPFFRHYAPDLEALFAHPWERLVDFDLRMLDLCLRWFQIGTKRVLASSLALQGQKTERILHMCERTGAKVYVSGKGGSLEYLDLPAFDRQQVALEWQTFSHPTYLQRYPEIGFVKNLAAIDLLLNCGPESRRLLFTEEPSWKVSSPKDLKDAPFSSAPIPTTSKLVQVEPSPA
jgi:WbqC-like protein family